MPEYSYIFTHLLSRRKIADLRMYGVSFSKKINQSGTFTGTIRLDNPLYRSTQYILDGSMPGFTGLYVQRDRQLIWGGIVTSRTYQSDGRSSQIFAQTFDVYAKKRVNKIDRSWNDDPKNIIRNIWNVIQSTSQGNLGIIIPSAFPNTTPTLKELKGFEYNSWGQVIDSIADIDPGYEYVTKEYFDPVDGLPRVELLIADRLGKGIDDPTLAFRYPGNIAKYWWPESVTPSGTNFTGIGKGDADEALRAEAVNQNLLNNGYPEWDVVTAWKDEASQVNLQARTNKLRDDYSTPVTVPTLELNGSKKPEIVDWELGSYANLYIEDTRFPGILRSKQRTIGWSLKPADGDGPEVVNVEIEGKEATS